MSFSFNFFPSNDIDIDNNESNKNETTILDSKTETVNVKDTITDSYLKQEQEQQEHQQHRIPFEWIIDLNDIFYDRVQEDEIVCIEINIATANANTSNSRGSGTNDTIDIDTDTDTDTNTDAVVDKYKYNNENNNNSNKSNIIRCVDLNLTSFRRKHNNDNSTDIDIELENDNVYRNNDINIDIETEPNTTVQVVSKSDITTNNKKEKLLSLWKTTTNKNSVTSNNVIQSGIYEGGSSIWECSIDLIQYFYKNNITIQSSSSKVLEIGCGHALPTCYLLRQALLQYYCTNSSDTTTTGTPYQQQQQQQPTFQFTITDYNDYVITDATISNIVLNTVNCYCTSHHNLDSNNNSISITPQIIIENQHLLAGAGDWIDMTTNYLSSNTTDTTTTKTLYNIIIASETLYNNITCYETALLLWNHLQPLSGIAYIATKRYYFGTGGSVTTFIQYCNEMSENTITSTKITKNTNTTGIASSIDIIQYQLVVQCIHTIDNGTGNIRELLSVTKQYVTNDTIS